MIVCHGVSFYCIFITVSLQLIVILQLPDGFSPNIQIHKSHRLLNLLAI